MTPMPKVNARAMLVALVLLGSATALAQAGIQISPANVKLSSQPGTTLHGQISVSNPGKAPMALSIVPSDFALSPDGQITTLPVGTLPQSLASWLNLGVSSLKVTPGDNPSYSYEVDIPKDASPGTHWGAILFRTPTSQPSSSGNAVGLQTRAQVAFIIAVDIPPLKQDGKVTDITLVPAKTGTSDASGSSEKPATLEVGFQNTGNAYLRLKGHVELRSGNGTVVATIDIPATPSFPGEATNLTATPAKPLKAGKYLATAVIDYGTQDVIAGQSTITVP